MPARWRSLSSGCGGSERPPNMTISLVAAELELAVQERAGDRALVESAQSLPALVARAAETLARCPCAAAPRPTGAGWRAATIRQIVCERSYTQARYRISIFR